MLIPNASNLVGWIVLIPGKPEFAFLGYDIENLTVDIGKIRIASFSPSTINVELEKASG
jgi:hypothetical protein